LVAIPPLRSTGRWIVAITVVAVLVLGALAWVVTSFDDAPDPHEMAPEATAVSVQDAVEAMLYSIRQNESALVQKKLLTDLATLALALGVGVLVLAKATGSA